MNLAMACLLHPRQHVVRMMELSATTAKLGWASYDTYGIVLDGKGYYVDCTWYATKPSVEAAQEELARHGITPLECQVLPHEELSAVMARRHAEGYYDDCDIHA